MYDVFVKTVTSLPVLKSQKKPGLAACIGFLFGGIGLALYFRSFVDFLYPVAAVIVLTVGSSAVTTSLASVGWLAGAVFAGMYGFYRAQDSNHRLLTQAPRMA